MEISEFKGEAIRLEGATGESLTGDARLATETEHALGFKQAMKLYRKAVFWSFVVSLSIIMEAYDTQLIGSFFGFPPFQKKYGEPYKGGYQIQAHWQNNDINLGIEGNHGLPY